MRKTENNNLSLSKKILYGATNWLLFFAGILNLSVGTWAAIQMNVAMSATSLTAGLILLFASTIDRFESLKGLGIEAKTKKLDEKIELADEMFKRLRELTEITGTALIANNARAGRWSGAPKPIESFTLAENIRSTLERLEADEISIKKVLYPWVKITILDLNNRILKPLWEAIQSEKNILNDQRNNLGSPINPLNPEFIKITNLHKTLGEYSSLQKKISNFEIEDFPEKVIEIISQVQLSNMQPVKDVQEKILSFAPSMINFRNTYKLNEPAKWFAEINPMFEE